MKLARNTIRALAVGAFLLAAGIIAVQFWTERGEEVFIYIDQVPGPARAAILKEAADGAIRKVEVAAGDGREIYAAEIITGTMRIEVKVTPDGQVLSRQEEDYTGPGGRDEQVSLEEVPAAARETILREAQGAELTELERKQRRGEPIYAAEFMAGEKEVEVWVAEDGTVLSREMHEPDGK